MPQNTTADKNVLLEQEHRTIEWLSNLNLVEFIRLEMPRLLMDLDSEELEEHKAEHFAEICNNMECYEVQELASILIGLMPPSHQHFICIREDVCAHLMRYLPAALAPL